MKYSALEFEDYDKTVRIYYAAAVGLFLTGIGIPFSIFLFAYGLGLSKGKTKTLKVVQEEIEE